MRLPLFRSRPSRAVTSRLFTKGQAAAVPPPPPQPRELIDVIGVGATETAGGVALTLLSLERNREGQAALFRLMAEAQRGDIQGGGRGHRAVAFQHHALTLRV